MGLREEFILTPADLKRSPMELFSLCENVLALKPQAKSPDARKWNENTQSTYHRMMDRMQTFYFEPLGLPFDELEFEHFDQAVEAYASQSRGRGKENGKISEATRDKLRSILKSLTDFVHEKLPEYADPFWGSVWNYRPMVLPQNVSATRKKELRQIRKDEIAEIVKLPRSLQVREEIKFATILREKLTQPDGVAIGGLLMLYLGLRPGECCGLTYGAIQPLVQDGQTRVLYIYQALDTSNRKNTPAQDQECLSRIAHTGRIGCSAEGAAELRRKPAYSGPDEPYKRIPHCKFARRFRPAMPPKIFWRHHHQSAAQHPNQRGKPCLCFLFAYQRAVGPGGKPYCLSAAPPLCHDSFQCL